MEVLKKFQNMELNHKEYNSVLGGKARNTEPSETGTKCTDCHEDDNNNGRIDPGECVTLIDCEDLC